MHILKGKGTSAILLDASPTDVCQEGSKYSFPVSGFLPLWGHLYSQNHAAHNATASFYALLQQLDNALICA